MADEQVYPISRIYLTGGQVAFEADHVASDTEPARLIREYAIFGPDGELVGFSNRRGREVDIPRLKAGNSVTITALLSLDGKELYDPARRAAAR